MTRQRSFAWAAAMALVAGAAAAAADPKADPNAEAQAARGRVIFRAYCSNCHGPAGRGDGKISNLLKVAPADLTRLAARNGGVFDRVRVIAYVDGREDVAAHGEREMPIWGFAFQPIDSTKPDEARVRAKLEDLVSFLQSIQRR
jgi:mono/diheme cytochrome c family protein